MFLWVAISSCIHRISSLIFWNAWHNLLYLNTRGLEKIKNIKLDTKGLNFFNFTRVSILYTPSLAVLAVVVWPAWAAQTISRVLFNSSPRRMWSVTHSCRSPTEISIKKGKYKMLFFFFFFATLGVSSVKYISMPMVFCFFFFPECGSKSKEVHGNFSEELFFSHLFHLLPNSLLSLAVPYFSTKQDMSYVGQVRHLSCI